MREPTRAELEAAHCWENEDAVPGRPLMTAFRRRVRYGQALWRERSRHPIGTQPIVPGPKGSRPIGSRLPLEYAQKTAANFLTPAAVTAARSRLSTPEPHQNIDHQRLWADLLWSPALAINLFAGLPTGAIPRLWPDAAGRLREVRFSHSPGWLDPAYLGSLRRFDACLYLDGGVIAVDVRYHEWAKPETPRPENMSRYRAVAERSGAFRPGAVDVLARRSEFCLTWLEHLLLLSMLQHPGRAWRWGRYVVVYPRGNADMRDVCARYGEFLVDGSSFAAITLEELLAAEALAAATAAAVSARYFG